MTTYYLKPTAAGGSDANPGDSPLSAWATLSRAAQRLWQPGDQLLIAPAVYHETSKFAFRGGGDPDRPVIIAGDGGRPTFSFAAALAEDPKFVISGVGFVARDLGVTQPTRGVTPADRLLCAQADEQHLADVVSDVTFLRCATWEGYQPLKTTDAPRTRFLGCEVYDCALGPGITGRSDDSSLEECLIHDFSEDGAQTKGGVRDARILRCTIVGDAATNVGITLGGASTFSPGDTWGRPDADYEAANALAESNVIIGVPGHTLYAGIRFQGAKNCAAINNTIVSLPGCVMWTDGVMDGIDVRASTGTGWDLGAPGCSGVMVANNLFVFVAATMETKTVPGGTNVWRDNLAHLVDWVTVEGDASGTWTYAATTVGDPLLTRYAGVADWRDLDLRLGPDSPAHGVATLPRPLGYDGAPLPSGNDRDDIARGSAVDAGAYDATARRRRKQRHPVRRGRR